jgi:hypothetical protein
LELESNLTNSDIKKIENGIVYLQEKRKIDLNSILNIYKTNNIIINNYNPMD